MAGLRHVGILGRLIIWHPFRLIFFKNFSLGDGWRTFGGGGGRHAKIVDNFWRKVPAHGKLTLVAAYFQLFQWHLSAPYKLAPLAAVQLSCQLFRLCLS